MTGVDLYAMQRDHRAAWQEKLDNAEEERELLAEEEEERKREAEEIAELDRVEKELAEKHRAETIAKQHAVWRDVCIRQEQERARTALLRAARGRAEEGVCKENDSGQNSLGTTTSSWLTSKPVTVPNFILDSSSSEPEGEGDGTEMQQLSQGASEISLTAIQCGQEDQCGNVSESKQFTASVQPAGRGEEEVQMETCCGERGREGKGTESEVGDVSASDTDGGDGCGGDELSQNPSDQGDADQPRFFTQACEYEAAPRRSHRRSGKVKIPSQDIPTSQESAIFGSDTQARGSYRFARGKVSLAAPKTESASDSGSDSDFVGAA
eukprot:749080-Rhodomonas_salina.1